MRKKRNLDVCSLEIAFRNILVGEFYGKSTTKNFPQERRFEIQSVKKRSLRGEITQLLEITSEAVKATK